MRFTHSKDGHTHIEIQANSDGSDSRFWSALLERRSTRRAALATAASALAATAILAACGDDDREPRRDARKPDGPGVVTSRDGTRIAYDRLGQGPAVIQVAGALGYRAHPIMAGLASALATHFTVFNYDRRGRGDSGDTPPYSVDREIEDIEALIQEAGGSAYLYGLSSGGVLALAAANELTTKVTNLALYEPHRRRGPSAVAAGLCATDQ